MPTAKETKAANKAIAAAASPGPVPNCVWSNNNSACVNTWFYLGPDIMGQHNRDFEAVETLKMSQLAYWNDDAGGTREVEAKAIAQMLTRLFKNDVGAEYESGHNETSAVEAMSGILLQKDKTMCELAAVVDEVHHFLTE